MDRHLVIRDEQIAALARDARERNERAIALGLRARYPDLTAALDDLALRALIAAAVDKAVGYGIEGPRDLVHFVDYAVRLGPAFDVDPRFSWTREILDDAALSGADKILWIDDGLEVRS